MLAADGEVADGYVVFVDGKILPCGHVLVGGFQSLRHVDLPTVVGKELVAVGPCEHFVGHPQAVQAIAFPFQIDFQQQLAVQKNGVAYLIYRFWNGDSAQVGVEESPLAYLLRTVLHLIAGSFDVQDFNVFFVAQWQSGGIADELAVVIFCIKHAVAHCKAGVFRVNEDFFQHERGEGRVADACHGRWNVNPLEDGAQEAPLANGGESLVQRRFVHVLAAGESRFSEGFHRAGQIYAL